MKNLITKIEANKEINKRINNERYYDSERFISDAKRYIKAIKERRMICSIASVSQSGMSRQIKFISCEKSKTSYYYSNYNMLFDILGFTKSRNNDFYFTISGCGMDMIFHTNYTIIHRLHRLGFISKNVCDVLAQQTPSVI